MTKKEYDQYIIDLEEPLGWDPRGDEEEYELLDKANDAWAELKELLRTQVYPNLKK